MAEANSIDVRQLRVAGRQQHRANAGSAGDSILPRKPSISIIDDPLRLSTDTVV